jgi:hypothetical protein
MRRVAEHLMDAFLVVRRDAERKHQFIIRFWLTVAEVTALPPPRVQFIRWLRRAFGAGDFGEGVNTAASD